MENLMLLVLGGIGLAYLAASAFVVFILQAFVPKDRVRLRVGVVVALVWVAIAIPPLYMMRFERAQAGERQAQRDRVAEECRRASVQVASSASSTAYFIDQRYLDMVWPRNGKPPRFDEVLLFMLGQRLETLELRPPKDFLPVELRGGQGAGPVVRLQLKREGGAACAGFDAWLADFAVYKIPPLRLAGLPVDACVGVDFLEQPEARHRLEVTETVLESTPQGTWRKQYEVTLRDVADPGQTHGARLVEQHASGGGSGVFWFPCGEAAQERLAAFGRAMTSPGTPMIRPPAVVPVTGKHQLAPQVPDAVLQQYRWLVQPGRAWASNFISPDGLAWVQDISAPMGGVHAGAARLDGHVLSVLLGGELLQAPVRWMAEDAESVTGIGVAGDRVAVVAYAPGGRAKAEAVLFELDLQARRVHASRLIPGQLPELPLPVPR